jgi:hypothetical protein
VWDRIRSKAVRDDWKTVEQLLQEEGRTPIPELVWLLGFLLRARDRREELRRQLEQLEAIERAFGAALDNPARRDGVGQVDAGRA